MPPQKHVVDQVPLAVTSATQTSMLIAKGVINPDPYTNNYECRAGSVIGALTVSIDVDIDRAQFGNYDPFSFDWGIFYNINDQQTAPSMDQVMGSSGADMINQIIHQDGCILAVPYASSTTDPGQHSWRLTVALPRSWSKLNRGDTIRLYFKFGVAIKTWIKIRVIYKEYFP